MSLVWPNAETVTVVHMGPRDPYGDTTEASREDVSGVLLAPRREAGADERATPDRNLVTVDLVAYAAGDAQISATDRVIRQLDGKEYEVVGEPARWRNPWSSDPDQLEINLKRVTG